MREEISIGLIGNPRDAGAGRLSCLSAAIAIVLAAALQPSDAHAQAAASGARAGALEEIVVTARRREEAVQSIPATIQVLGGDSLMDRAVLRPQELQFAVPGFFVQNYETRATITMRGVGAQIPGGTSAVATHLNGVYQASAAAQLNRLFDVERVEVLKGPQGTLYGRNSTGGALNIVTRTPGNEFAADAELAYGSYETVRFDGGVSMPLGDDWAVRLAASYAKSNEGRFTNRFNGEKIAKEDFLGGRVTLAGDAGPVRVEAWLQVVQDDSFTTPLIPLVAGTKEPLYDWDETYFDFPTDPSLEKDSTMAGLTLSGDINDRYSWRAITGYIDYEDVGLLDVNPRPAPVQLFIQFPQTAEQFTQELQLLYTGDRLNWVLGAYYLDDEQGERRLVAFNGAPFSLLNSRSTNKAEVFALFGDMNYNLTDQLRLNVGLRWTTEDVQNIYESGGGLFDGTPFDLSGTQGDPSGRIGLDYTIRDGLMVYGSVSTGYQAGFFDVRADPEGGDDLPSEVDPEELLAFEVGMKSILPEGRGFLNIAAFYYDYQDMQVLKGGIFLLPDGTPDPDQPPFYFTDNAAAAEIYGIDLELTELRAAEHLSFDFIATYLHAEYDEYETVDDAQNPVDYSGNRLPRAPEWMLTSSVNIDNLRLGDAAEAGITLEYNYRSKTYFTEDNNPIATQDAFGLLNLYANIDFDGGRWGLRFAGRNLTDEKFFNFHRGDVIANVGEFRTYEMAVRYRF